MHPRLPLHLRAALADLYRAEAYAAELTAPAESDYLHTVADDLHESMSSREYEDVMNRWTESEHHDRDDFADELRRAG